LHFSKLAKVIIRSYKIDLNEEYALIVNSKIARLFADWKTLNICIVEMYTSSKLLSVKMSFSEWKKAHRGLKSHSVGNVMKDSVNELQFIFYYLKFSDQLHPTW